MPRYHLYPTGQLTRHRTLSQCARSWTPVKRFPRGLRTWLKSTGLVTGNKGGLDGDATYARTGFQFDYDEKTQEGKIVSLFDWL